MADAVRTGPERTADTMARLEHDEDIWVATALDGNPHLVPMSFAWDGHRVIVATPAGSPTARNAVGGGRLKLALGPTRDVTIFDADVAVVACTQADPVVAQGFEDRLGWDPRAEAVPHVFLLATLRTARAWRTVAELDSRTIMRTGVWLDA